MKLCDRFRGRTVAGIATGPSLTLSQIESARRKGFVLFGCNRVWEIVPDLEVLYGCNEGFWAHYWCEALANHPAQKWTTNRVAADRFQLNWIAERNAPGLSSDSAYVHHGHGSGFTLVNLAHLMGAERIVLLGYDMRYAPDYDGVAHQIGSSPRHYFGEYPSALQHWPSVKVRDGVHVELVELYESVAKQGLVEIVNCTPDSAVTCFPMRSIDAL
jgi:hypothetical protein